MTHRTPRSLALLALASTGLVAPALLALPASAAGSPTVRWTDRSVVSGRAVTARVARSQVASGTHLALQRHYFDKWRTVEGPTSTTTDDYVFKVPTGEYGRFTYRVREISDADGSTVAMSDTSQVAVRPPYSPPGKASEYTFNGKPRIRWDSCSGQITWKFYAPHAPRNGLKQVKQGFARIHRATGLKFKYAGRTAMLPTPYGHVKGADVSIGWRTRAGYKPFRQQGVVGIGGNEYQGGWQEGPSGKRININRAIKGGTVLNASMGRYFKNGYGKGYTWGEVIIHELGHVMGLGHTPASSQIMYYAVTKRNADWGAGDLHGLRYEGDTRGCLTRSFARARPVIHRTEAY